MIWDYFTYVYTLKVFMILCTIESSEGSSNSSQNMDSMLRYYFLGQVPMMKKKSGCQ